MGKRTTSSKRGKSRKGGGKGKSKSTALEYASKIEQLAQDRKQLEKDVRDDIDTLSEDIGQFVAHEVDVGKAPDTLEKARAAADGKDFNTARRHLDRAKKSMVKTASKQVEERINEAQSTINAVERLGVVEADLGDLLTDARKLLTKKELLPALETAEGAAKRAVELAQNQLTEVVSISEMLIKDAEDEGLDVSRAQEFLEKARSAVEEGAYEAAVENTLQVQTSLDRARKGLTSEADEEGIVLEDLVAEEDREYVEDIIQKGLDRLEVDLGTLEEIRGLVSHPENLASKARKALEEGSLGQARKLLRDAHLATIRAVRERLQDVLNAASERMKKAKREGLNLQEIRTVYNQGVMAVDTYKFKEAYDKAMSIEDMINKVKEEKEEIDSSIFEAEEEISELVDIGTNEARVNELMDQARKNLERGDFKKARLNVAKAISTAKTSTQSFINNYIIEVRNVLLSARTVGGNIATARPMLITAKKEMNKKAYHKAVELVNDSINTIKGIDQEYLDTIIELMKSKYHYTMAETLGLNVVEVGENLEQAFQELKNKSYDKAIKLAQKTDFEVEIITEDFKTTSEDLATAKEAINEGKKVGADVTEADFLLSKAITQIEKNSFEVAQELLTDAIEAAEKARSQRVGALLDEAKTLISEEEQSGVAVEEGMSLLGEAEKAYKRADYSTTIEMINEAVMVMGDSSRRMEAAKGELVQAEELLEETAKYAEANPLAEDFITTARNLLAGGQYPEAYDVARQAIMDLEASLVRYIDLIMEDTKSEISKAEAAGASVPKARDSYKLARRYLDKQDPATALNLARKASNMAREILTVFQEVMENVDLLDSYIEWGRRVSRRLDMPVEELEQANALIKEKNFAEAQTLVTTALEEAKQAQVSFVEQELEEVDVFLRELEAGGVGTSVARNTLNQAHSSLEEMNFEQAYTLASQAREQGVKNQELYGEIIEKRQKGMERLKLAEGLGVDTSSLQELVDKAEKALINQTYTFALDFVDQLLGELPKVTQVYINRRFNDATDHLNEAKYLGLIVDDQQTLLDRAMEIASQGILEETVETLDRLELDLRGLRERYTDAEGALKHLAEVLEAAEEIGVESTGPRNLEAEASQALVANDFKAVHRVVAEAEDELIRTSSTFIVDYINRVQSTLAKLERTGAFVRPVEQKVDLAWSQLDDRRFTEAFATARECTLTMQRVEGEFHELHDRFQAAKANVDRMGFMEIDTGDATMVMSKAHEALTELDFDRTERHITEALEELALSLREAAKAQITELEGLIEATSDQGADMSSARERLERAQNLMDMGKLQMAYLTVLEGMEAVDRAQREMTDAVEGRRRAEEAFRDAEELGADISRAKELLAEIDDDLTDKHYKDAINRVRRLVLETHKAKNDYVLSLLNDGENALIEAEELGLSVKVLRTELTQGEEQMEEDLFHDAVATVQGATEAARDLIDQFITARDRIVEVQSLVYDASGIGTNTSRATDLLGEARDALSEQRLEEALQLADRAEEEIKERQKEMASYEFEAIRDLRDEAEELGMVVLSIVNSIEQAEDMMGAEDFKSAVIRLREGIEEGRSLLVKFQVAKESIDKSQVLLDVMNQLELDSGVPSAELEKASRSLPDEKYDQAKELADVVAGDIVRILDDHINQRIEDLRGQFTRADEVGIRVSDVAQAFDEAMTTVDLTDYLVVSTIVDEHKAKVKERTAAYDDALSRIEEAETLFSDAEDLQVDVSTARPTMEAARQALSAGNYGEAAERGDDAKEQVLELQRQFVLKYIDDAQALIDELNKMGVDTIAPAEYLEQARAALDLEEYPSAHASAVETINACQESKEKYLEAKNLIDEARKTIERTRSLEIDPKSAEELLEQAIDSLEFQSYEESKDFATKSRQEAGRLMREHVETALEVLQEDAGEAVGTGIEFSKGLQVIDLASERLAEAAFIEAMDAVDAGRAHLEQRQELHQRLEKIHEAVFEELENAETLGVDVGIYESDLQRFRTLHEGREYGQAIPWGVSLLERLGSDENSMMDIYIGEVMDLFDGLLEKGGRPKGPLEPLQKSLDYFNQGDFIRSYNFLIRAREGIETDSRSLEKAREVSREALQTIIYAEGMGIPTEEARSELDTGTQLMDTSDYGPSVEAFTRADRIATDSVAAAARDTLERAEARAEEVADHGANSATVSDRARRGRRSLEEDDYGYALVFGQLALSAALRAEEELAEANRLLAQVSDQVDMAAEILEDPSDIQAYHENITEAMETRRIREAIKRSRTALVAINTKLRASIQSKIERVQDDIRLMELMGLESETMAERLNEARDEMEAGRFMEAATIAIDVHGPVRSFMDDRARTTLEDAKEAVDSMKTIGADDTEVTQGLNQTQDLFAAKDFYHSNELSARTAQRAREVSDLTISGIIDGIHRLMEEADLLGVETGELEKRVDRAERQRSNGRFVEAKGTLDELAKDLDAAQMELVKGLVETCDKLSEISSDRELDTRDAGRDLEEAHHYLSIKNYKGALESARSSFAVFEEVFTDLVRNTLQEAKDLLVNLDVSADIETSSDHYVEAEEALQRRDYISALANADAAMANARVIQVRIIEEILEKVEVENQRGRAMDADMAPSEDMASMAQEELADNNLESAQSQALQALEEARSLQQAHAATLLQTARTAVEEVPFEVELDDLRELVESSAASLEGGDYEAAADAAVQVTTILNDRLETGVREYIVQAEADAERGSEVGIDLTGPKEHLKDAKDRLEVADYLAAQEAARMCIDLISDLITKHQQAQEALSDLMELIERATRARAKLSESMDMQEAAEDAMDEHDYDRVLEMVELAKEDANRSYEARVKEAISTAESKLSTLESMGASAKLAEEMLTEARQALEEGDLDGAYDYADQSIREADQAKSSFRDIIDITFQAESLIGTAKGFGMEVEEAQSKFDEALATRNEDVNRALALAEEAKAIAAALVDSFYPELDVAMELESALVLDKWTNSNLMVRNDGSARALRVKIELEGNIDVDGLGEINILRGKGKVKKLPIRVKPLKSGEIMVRVWVRCEREYDDKPYEFHDVRWLLADEEEPDEEAEPGAQFLRKELTCTICQGKIGTQDAPRACSCGATFHQDCSVQLTECPNCGKSLGGE